MAATCVAERRPNDDKKRPKVSILSYTGISIFITARHLGMPPELIPPPLHRRSGDDGHLLTDHLPLS